jgi:hypothetical protein
MSYNEIFDIAHFSLEAFDEEVEVVNVTEAEDSHDTLARQQRRSTKHLHRVHLHDTHLKTQYQGALVGDQCSHEIKTNLLAEIQGFGNDVGPCDAEADAQEVCARHPYIEISHTLSLLL